MKLQYQAPAAHIVFLSCDDVMTLSVGSGAPKIGEERTVIDFEG